MDRALWGADFEGRALKRRLWPLYSTWQSGGPKPSDQLGITYPWVAIDLDTAAHALGKHIEAEADKARRAEEKALNPKPSGGGGKWSKGAGPREHKSLPEERRREIWLEVVARIVDDRLVWYHAGEGDTGRWRTEKPITGDPKIDQVQLSGARVVYDGQGRRRAEFDAGGKRTFFWKPKTSEG